MHAMRIGLGIDVHRLITDPARPLMLGGVEIPGDLALQGHSDADALLHAITDAILGALALGDIGEYFPDTDPLWKNAPSERFLRHALTAMIQQGYRLANIDCVIMAEAPKIAPYRVAIREQLAEYLDLEPNAVGLKATTAEKLGSLGRGEGLFAQAVVLLERDDVRPAKPSKAESETKKPPVRERVRPEAARMVEPTAAKGRVIQAWADGASRGNPGPASIGVIIKDLDGGVIHAAGQRVGEVTNNVAEYRSLIYVLQLAGALMPTRLDIHMDSELVVKQMKGIYRVKEPTLQKLHAQAMAAAELLNAVTYQHVPREQNREADRLANQALDGEFD